MNNKMTLEVNAIPQNEGFVRGCVAAFAAQCDPTVDVLNDIKTAVSEAVTNCVVHAYKQDETGIIKIKSTLCDGIFSIEITDFGEGIDNVEKALEDFYSTKKEEERSGLGFTIMKSFMDDLKVISEKNVGTTVIMTKNLVENVKR